MNTTFSESGLKINASKTKTLVVSKRTVVTSISLGNTVIEQVKKFKYLGSIITDDSRCTPDIVARIAMAKQAFNLKRPLLTAKISRSTRKKLVKVYIWSIALYGCETWTMTQRDRERLQAFEMWCWRRLEKISWTEKKTNEEVLRIVSEKRSLLKVIENRRGKMIGHLLRHDDLIKVIIEGKIEGRRKRGRPRRAYMEQLKENIEVETYRELKEKAENRTEWKLLHRQELSS
jgi:hypothetical protein